MLQKHLNITYLLSYLFVFVLSLGGSQISQAEKGKKTTPYSQLLLDVARKIVKNDQKLTEEQKKAIAEAIEKANTLEEVRFEASSIEGLCWWVCTTLTWLGTVYVFYSALTGPGSYPFMAAAYTLCGIAFFDFATQITEVPFSLVNHFVSACFSDHQKVLKALLLQHGLLGKIEPTACSLEASQEIFEHLKGWLKEKKGSWDGIFDALKLTTLLEVYQYLNFFHTKSEAWKPPNEEMKVGKEIYHFLFEKGLPFDVYIPTPYEVQEHKWLFKRLKKAFSKRGPIKNYIDKIAKEKQFSKIELLLGQKKDHQERVKKWESLLRLLEKEDGTSHFSQAVWIGGLLQCVVYISLISHKGAKYNFSLNREAVFSGLGAFVMGYTCMLFYRYVVLEARVRSSIDKCFSQELQVMIAPSYRYSRWSAFARSFILPVLLVGLVGIYPMSSFFRVDFLVGLLNLLKEHFTQNKCYLGDLLGLMFLTVFPILFLTYFVDPFASLLEFAEKKLPFDQLDQMVDWLDKNREGYAKDQERVESDFKQWVKDKYNENDVNRITGCQLSRLQVVVKKNAWDDLSESEKRFIDLGMDGYGFPPEVLAEPKGGRPSSSFVSPAHKQRKMERTTTHKPKSVVQTSSSAPDASYTGLLVTFLVLLLCLLGAGLWWWKKRQKMPTMEENKEV